MLDLSAKHQIDVFYDGDGARPEPPRDGATSAQARALAWRFSQANNELITAIERCTPEQWQAICSDTAGAWQCRHITLLIITLIWLACFSRSRRGCRCHP